ncbi:translation initiation factor IF-2 [Algivirga pacifica]|uniref:Translation initiation factor IF-2 n=1 Tax=Algivirga pacifica TaxID=1162670 RepID=A0ABP9DMH2_9BACT
MADQKTVRLSQAAKKLNVGKDTIIEYLDGKGHEVKNSPNTRLSAEQYSLLEKAYASSKAEKEEAKSISIGSKVSDTVIEKDSGKAEEGVEQPAEKAAADSKQTPVEADKTSEDTADKEPEVFSAKKEYKVLGKIDLDAPKKGKAKSTETAKEKAATEPEKVEAKKEEKKPSPVVEEKKPEVEVKKAAEPKKEPEVKAEAKPEAKKELPKEAPKKQPVEKEQKPVAKEPVKEQPSEKKPEVVSPKGKDDKKEESKVKNVEQPKAAETENIPVPANKNKQEKPVEKKQEKKEETSTEKVTPSNVEETKPEKTIKAEAEKLQGLKVVGKIQLPEPRGRKGAAKPVASSDDKKERRGGNKNRHKKKGGRPDQPAGNAANKGGADKGGASTQNRDNNRGRGGAATGSNTTDNRGGGNNNGPNRKKKGRRKEQPSQQEVDKGFKSTMSQMSNKGGGKGSRAKYSKAKKAQQQAEREQRMQHEAAEANVLKVTEFVSTNELATLMSVDVNQIIATCLQLGIFISINQRLDSDTITMVAEEFGFEVQFTSAEEEADVMVDEQEDKEEDLVPRAPIVTIMGHVDHGKTSLLDYIRKANVAEGEAGGITQHIGAYDVTTSKGERIAFLDTPGHEAFTAMRARGAKLTDVAIIVIAADDSVMPQTIEAINHAQVAEVPIVFAINKIDKPGASPDKIRQELSGMNILVEEWGGKFQCYEISAKKGIGIEDLLDGVLLEAEVLELKANPDKKAIGTVVEASLDKGRGYVSTVMVQGGTMAIGDVMLAGPYFGKVKAMTDHRGNRLKKVGPATPVQVLGLNGAPQAGDRMTVMNTEREARELASKREQIIREQSIRATQRTTLDMIGKRIAQGGFHQLNVIVKGDVDGSVEALSDSLLKLSTDEVEVRIIHKAVGAISESDVMLAAADKDSDMTTIMIGFQVRPTANARKLAEKEGIEIRTYSVIYDAINDVKDAMEGLLAPDIEEVIVGNIQVRDVFKISKIGTVAGCFVLDGYIKRSSKIRLIRDGIVIYGGEQGGEVAALKRFKDDVTEVKQGYECGLSIVNYNDIKVDDIIEVFEHKEVKRTLS